VDGNVIGAWEVPATATAKLAASYGRSCAWVTDDPSAPGREGSVLREEPRRPGVGDCDEHGGDPSSIRFFHAAGVDYVSCSPFRVPIARVAAAQAAGQ
jgi:hypothetical protein